MIIFITFLKKYILEEERKDILKLWAGYYISFIHICILDKIYTVYACFYSLSIGLSLERRRKIDCLLVRESKVLLMYSNQCLQWHARVKIILKASTWLFNLSQSLSNSVWQFKETWYEVQLFDTDISFSYGYSFQYNYIAECLIQYAWDLTSPKISYPLYFSWDTQGVNCW